MNGKTVVITEINGKYSVENNGISEFALLGILECIVFEMKSAKREAVAAESIPVNAPPPLANQEEKVVQESNAPELRTRIANAVKAIRDLGGQTSDLDLSTASDQELKDELEALKEQYKRLKSSKSAGK